MYQANGSRSYDYTLNMNKKSSGSFHLVNLFGIDVQLHWTWFVVAAIQLHYAQLFRHPVWHLVTYLALFAIVLLHEFGHALACRSVGGQADRIVLWPLGGIAFVRPPFRPGAVLWSIAAGPLVNVILVPITVLAYVLVATDTTVVSQFSQMKDIELVLLAICVMNLWILGFNLLPIYPLDGGQILQALLWFFLGPARSLKIATIIGLMVAAVTAVGSLLAGRVWLLLMALFIGWQSWNGWRNAQWLLRWEERLSNVPRS